MGQFITNVDFYALLWDLMIAEIGKDRNLRQHMALIAHLLHDSYHQEKMCNFCQNCHAKQMSSLLCLSH